MSLYNQAWASVNTATSTRKIEQFFIPPFFFLLFLLRYFYLLRSLLRCFPPRWIINFESRAVKRVLRRAMLAGQRLLCAFHLFIRQQLHPETVSREDTRSTFPRSEKRAFPALSSPSCATLRGSPAMFKQNQLSQWSQNRIYLSNHCENQFRLLLSLTIASITVVSCLFAS